MAGRMLDAELRITAKNLTRAGLDAAASDVRRTAAGMERTIALSAARTRVDAARIAAESRGRLDAALVGGTARTRLEAAQILAESRANNGRVSAMRMGIGQAAIGMRGLVGGLLAVDGVVRAVTAVGQAAYESDQELSTLGITAGVTAEEIDRAFSRLTIAGTNVHQSGRTLVGVSNQLVAAGLALDDATGSAASASRLATAYGAEMRDVGNLTSALFTGFGANVGSVDRYFDAVATGSKRGQIEVKDLASGLGSLAGPAKLIGMDTLEGFQRLVAFAEVSRTTAGDNAEAINNARNALIKMIAPDVQKNFKKMGVDWQAAMKAGARDGKDLLEVLRDAVMTATKGDLTKLTRLFPDQQAAAAVTALITGWEKYKDILGEVRTETGVVAKDAAAKVDTMSGSVDRLHAAWGNWLDMVARRTAPTLRGAAAATADVLESATARGSMKEQFDETYARLRPNDWLGGFGARLAGPRFDNALALDAERVRKGLMTPEQGYRSAQDLAWRAAGGERQELDREASRGVAYGRLGSASATAARDVVARSLPAPNPLRTPTEAAVGAGLDRLAGLLDGAPTRVGEATSSRGVFDPMTRPYDPRLMPPMAMRHAGAAYQARMLVTPLGRDLGEAERMIALRDGRAAPPAPDVPAPTGAAALPLPRERPRTAAAFPAVRPEPLGPGGFVRGAVGILERREGSPFGGARYPVPEPSAVSIFPARPEPLGPGGFTRSEAAVSASLDRLAGMFDGAATRIGEATTAQGAFDPVTVPHDPRLLPPLRMREGEDGTFSAPRLKTTPMGSDAGEGARMVALLESLKAPGAITAVVKDPVKAEIQGRAQVDVRVQVDGGRVVGASSTSSGHIETNVGTSMPHVERPGGIGSR